ncbi:MAG TPA: FAD-dependent oxidoreductase, partial [Nannocystis sp.]
GGRGAAHTARPRRAPLRSRIDWPVVVLGAGLTGLSAAYHSRHPVLLVEREDRVGGHARSVRRDGFVFDVTGHWLHLRDPAIRALVEGLFAPGELTTVARRTCVYSHGVLLPYPFQANLHGLPLPVVQECLTGYVEARERAARGAPEPRTFVGFAEARFGVGIARHFFVPYNRKLWGEHLDHLTAEWVSRYIPIPDTAQVIGGAIGLPQEGLGYNASFVYPTAGGIDALPERIRAALAARPDVELRLACAVEEVDVVRRRIKLQDDPDWRSYDALVSTIPLPELVRRISGAPADVRDAAAALRHLRWRWLDIAVGAPVPATYHWVYVPEPRFPFFRVGVYSNAVPGMAPPGCASLYVELNERTGPIDLPGVLAGLVEIGALRAPGDVRFVEVRELEHAYVVFDAAWAAARGRILTWLEGHRIHSCGRYGGWTYNGMEDCLIAGRDAAAWLDRRAPSEASP